MLVYLAGPDVFHPQGEAIGARKKAICGRYGLTGLFPLDVELNAQAGASVSETIFYGNQRLMDRSDAIIANLTPFRGPSADAGTVFELGYMAGKGRICLGYSNVLTPYSSRVRVHSRVQRSSRMLPVDVRGLIVESFDKPLADNLMIVHALEALGHPMVLPSERPRDPWNDLSAFERCVSLLAERASARPGTKPARSRAKLKDPVVSGESGNTPERE